MARYRAIKIDGVGSVLVKSKFRWSVFLASTVEESGTTRHKITFQIDQVAQFKGSQLSSSRLRIAYM